MKPTHRTAKKDNPGSGSRGAVRRQMIMGVDHASGEGDLTAEVDGYWENGLFFVTDVRRFKDTLDLEATDLTHQKQIES